jgi:hypothetical protein
MELMPAVVQAGTRRGVLLVSRYASSAATGKVISALLSGSLRQRRRLSGIAASS